MYELACVIHWVSFVKVWIESRRTPQCCVSLQAQYTLETLISHSPTSYISINTSKTR